jgi:hypothetical protein
MPMQRWRFQWRQQALAPEIERAGCALACAFSSSEEFEAAIIRARREAGVYGPKRRWRQLALGALIATLVIALALWLV